jgi:capsular polysaccharide transport system permease protein
MATYLYRYADDQYVTEFRFSVRHQAPLRVDPGGSEGMASTLAGGGAASMMTVMTDSQIVMQYLKSRQIVDDIIASGVDLDRIYAAEDEDILAHLRPKASVEERLRYWHRMVDPFFDMTTGVVSVEVRAFQPEDALLVANKALSLAEMLVNGMTERAHDDLLAYATREVDESGAKLQAIQGDIAAFRNKHAVLFPEMQATSASTVGGELEKTLIEAKTAYSTQMAQGASKDTMQMSILRNRIAAMESELRGVHGRLAQPEPAQGGDTSLATVMSAYSVLQLEEQISAKVYERALIAQQDARNAASQQSVYLAAFVRPSLPQDSMYPVRWRIMLETALLSFAGWCLLQLIYHAVRDHID